jgi:ABC-type transport system involved in multi-copper enzyme maturation permease subunit
LTNTQIVLGSLAARMFFVISLLIAGLPVFGITMLFGGVTADQILLTFGIAACTAVVFGAVAILISVTRLGTRGTILGFYVGVALYLMVGLALGRLSGTVVPASVVPGVSDGMTWLAAVHPFWSQMVALGQINAPAISDVAAYPWPLPYILAAPHVAYMLFALLSSMVMAAVATVFVRSGVRQGEASLWQRIYRKLSFGKLSGRAASTKRRRPRRVWANPVAWREAITRAGAANSRFARDAYLVLSILAGITFLILYAKGTFPNALAAREWLVWIVMTQITIVMLMTAATAASAITRERDDGTIELLLSTPLTSRYIIWGKLRGLISFALPLLAVPVATTLAVGLYDLWRSASPPVIPITQACALLVLVTVYAAFVSVIGLHMSLRSRRSIQAVVTTVGSLMGIACILSLLAWAVSAAQAQGFAAISFPFSFITALVFVLDPGVFISYASRTGATLSSELTIRLAVGTVLAGLVYTGVIVAMTRSMVSKFDMIIRKQSQ